MDKTNDKNSSERSISSANNFSANDAGINAHATLNPPTFQLKAEHNKPGSAEKEENTPTESPFQLAAEGISPPSPPQSSSDNNNLSPSQPNNTGLPIQLKSGVENLSGFSLNDVKVHYNSPKPAQLQAHAYAQGTDIHVASGQEKHLPHEAWHVVQQKQGRVQPTLQMKGGVNVNDNEGLETEADIMGERAMTIGNTELPSNNLRVGNTNGSSTQLTEVSDEEMDGALDLADDMIEDSGGSEAIDAVFGEGFSDRYHNVVVSMESGELSFDEIIGSLPEDDQIFIQNSIAEADYRYGELFDIVYDETIKSEEDVDPDKVSRALLLMDDLELRTELILVMNNYYSLLKAQGFIELIPGIIAFCKILAKLKYAFKLKELERLLQNLQNAVEKAESDVQKAALETGVDLVLGGVAVGLTAAGMMTPGLNIAIFLSGVAVGFALSTEDSSTKAVQTGTKGGAFVVGKALENSEKFGGHVLKIKSIGPGLDLILNGKETYDKYQQLAILQTALKEFNQYYDKECKTLMKDLQKDFKKLNGLVEITEKAFDANWDTLNNYEQQIATLSGQLEALGS